MCALQIYKDLDEKKGGNSSHTAFVKMVRAHFYKEVSKIMGWDFGSLHLISCSVHRFPVCLGTNCLTPLFVTSLLETGLTELAYFCGNFCEGKYCQRLRSLSSKISRKEQLKRFLSPAVYSSCCPCQVG